MTAEDLVGLGIADEVLPEPLGGAHRDPEAVFAVVGAAVARALDELATIPADALVEQPLRSAARDRRVLHDSAEE